MTSQKVPTQPEGNWPNGFPYLYHNTWCCAFPNLLYTLQGTGAPEIPVDQQYPRNRIGDEIIPTMIDIKLILEPQTDFAPQHSFFCRWVLTRRRTVWSPSATGAFAWAYDQTSPPVLGTTLWPEQIIAPLNSRSEGMDKIVKSGVWAFSLDKKSLVRSINVKLPRSKVSYRQLYAATSTTAPTGEDVAVPSNYTYQLWLCPYYDLNATETTPLISGMATARLYFKDP